MTERFITGNIAKCTKTPSTKMDCLFSQWKIAHVFTVVDMMATIYHVNQSFLALWPNIIK